MSFDRYKSMLIGYARVSTHEQTLALQQDALQKAGCSKIFTDTASGAKTERQGLEAALSYVRSGDSLVVWRLDRLGRSLPHLITTMTSLEEQGIGFKSLTENIDTTTSGGKLIFHIFGALAEFERNLIRERTQAGLTAATARARLQVDRYVHWGLGDFFRAWCLAEREGALSRLPSGSLG
jgi:DNA invertase Pin-like site-specific DNA recombinase